MGGHGGGDGFPDVGKFYFSGAEGFYGDFVGGVVNGGEGAAGEACGAGEGDGGEVFEAGGGEFELGEFGEIDGF